MVITFAVLTWLVFGAWAAGHAVLHKRDSRAVMAWGLCALTLPVIGATLYLLFGMNRIKRRATRLKEGARRRSKIAPSCKPSAPHMQPLASLVDAVSGRSLVPGNQVDVLCCGDAAYPQMIAAIRGAKHSVAMMSYIFDGDEEGQRFVDALADAHDRGVQVRVLVDDAGARYHHPPIDHLLKAHGVTVARFMPALPTRLPYFNLRNHRKILVVDGRIGFTGGMNIRGACVLASKPTAPVLDVHFRLEGPVVEQLSEVFWEDWYFTTQEALPNEPWFPPLDPSGDVLARVVAEGPDEDFERVRWTLLGAIACARSSIRIATPYFLPDPTIVTALTIAALRGVIVDIVVPARSNLPLLDSAMRSFIIQVIHGRCRVHASDPPFDHSKLMVVDDAWAFIGSANWDARSLRLNFEVNVELYDPAIARAVAKVIDEKIAGAHVVAVDDLTKRALHQRLWDGVARLMAPYL